MKINHDNFKVGRIIIVDDEVELMSALCEALAGQGYETTGFTAGADALKVLVEQDYDLLLTDLMMPEMDGIALLKAGLEIDPNLVGIIMTGHGTVPTAVEAMKKGAFDYVLKPFKLNTLLPLLSRAMEVRSLRMENIQLRETVAIHELGKVIAFSSDLNAILNKVADATLQQCNADEVSIMLPTREGKELYVAVSRGGHEEYIGERVPMERGIAGWVASNHETVIINGKVDDPRFSPDHPRTDIRCAVSMPMMAGGNLVGVLNVNVTRSNRHMTLGQVKALSILVSIISPILENTWLNIQIRLSEQKYRNIFDNVVEGIFQTTPEGRFLIANNVQAHLLGYASPEELIETVTDMGIQIYANPDDSKEYLRIMQEAGLVKGFEVQFRKKDSSITWVSLNARAVFDESHKLLYYEGTMEDINSGKQAEITLQKSRDELAVIIEGSAIPQFVINKDHVVILWNKALEIYSGMAAKDVLGTSDHWKAFYPEKRPCLVDLVIDDANEEEFARWYAKHKKSTFIDGAHEATGHFTGINDGVWLYLTAVSIYDSSGKMIAAIETLDDITDLKTTETSLRQSEQKYRSIFENSVEGIFQTTPEGRFLSVNPAVANLFGYASPQEFMEEIIDIGRQHYANPKDREIYKNILVTEGVIKGFEVQLINKDGNPIWASISARVIRSNEGAIINYEGTVVDITDRKQAEENLKEATEKLRKTLVGTIQAMSLTVETRDPYTAGHQRRVSSLARVIAQEMALPNNTVDIIRTAGILHDIGKIAVPSEILSKPTKLTDLEFSLIKVHSQSGYDILKDVGFPCNLAVTVLQHHERLDGSGYPQGLKNGQILLEAKILAVADVVEAIASHRPYRPAKGIDIALEEIEKNKDILYDAEVVEACVRLFREKRFGFE